MRMEETSTYKNIVEYARYLDKLNCAGEKKRKLLGEFLENKAREKKIPIQGIFELTPLCNLDCRMCYIHLNNSTFSERSLLPTDIWIDMIEQACQAGMRKATLTGGECLTYPGFNDIYLFLKNKKVDINVLSNGILLDCERIAFFKHNPPAVIKITLYGSNEEAYEIVTGHKMFNRVVDNLKNLKESGLKVELSITPSRFMEKDIKALIELAERLNFPYEINSRLIRPRANTGRSAEDLTLDQYLELYQIRAKLQKRPLYPIDIKKLPDENHTGVAQYGLRCGAGRSLFVINYNGGMMPCAALDEYSVSVLDQGFEKAWQMINQYVISYPIPCECQDCIYFPICTHCQGQHKNAEIGHCDPKMCERTKKLAEAGFYHYCGNEC